MAKRCPLISELVRGQNKTDLGRMGFRVEGKVRIMPRFLLWLFRTRMKSAEGPHVHIFVWSPQLHFHLLESHLILGGPAGGYLLWEGPHSFQGSSLPLGAISLIGLDCFLPWPMTSPVT